MKVLLDEMNLIFISFSMAKKKVFEKNGTDEFFEEDLPFFYHLYLNKMNDLFQEYGKLIICKEGHNSLDYRKQIYPQYKANRVQNKDNSYYVMKKSLPALDELMKNYPTKTIKVNGAEADDVIYALSMYFADNGEDVLVVSSDGDLTQLHNFNKKINIFNPIKRQLVKPKKEILKYKAIVGDRSDNIAGLYRIGDKTFEKMINDETIWNEKINKGDNKQLYENILKIVDLSVYPEEFHKKTIEEYENQKWNELDVGKVEYFMFENKLNDHLNRWGSVSTNIREALEETKIILEKDEINNITSNKEATEQIDVDKAVEDIDDFLKNIL